MRRVLICWLVILATASVAGGIDLDSLLAQSVGGGAAVDRLSKVTTYYGAGKAVLNGVPGTFELYVALPDRVYFQMVLGTFAITQAYDGQIAWQRDQSGMVNKLSGYEEAALLSQAFFMTYSQLFPDRLPGGREYLGVEEFHGASFHKVAFYPLRRDTVYSYYDLQSGVQTYDVMYMDNLETITEYLDHRDYQGVLTAYASRSSLPATGMVSELTLDSLIFNPPFELSLFELPESQIDYRFPEGVDLVVVPFQFVAGHIYVIAEVSGRKLAFILDSGASANFYHKPAVAGFNFPVVANLAAIGLAGYDRIDLITTDSVVVGDLVLLAQVGGAIDLTPLAGGWSGDIPFGGILGYSFLSRFPVLVDYGNRRLVVYNPARWSCPEGGHEVAFEYTMQIPTIEARLSGRSGKFLVDLGNALGLIVHDSFRRKHELDRDLGEIIDGGGKFGGVGGGVRGQTARAASFSFGDLSLSDVEVILPDSAGGLTGSVALAGNIGNRLLQNYRVLFDYSGQRLVFYETDQGGE